MVDGVDDSFVIETPDLRETLAALKEVSPKLARDVRRDLRKTGEEIIAGQRQILSGPLPPGVEVTGTKTRLVQPKDGRAPYFRKVNVYAERERAGRDYKRGMRAKIGSGLKTTVTTGKTRQGVSVRTNRRVGGVMSQVYQSQVFRHPVFSRAGNTFVHQRGLPYFWKPALAGRDAMAKRVEQLLVDAVAQMAKD